MALALAIGTCDRFHTHIKCSGGIVLCALYFTELICNEDLTFENSYFSGYVRVITNFGLLRSFVLLSKQDTSTILEIAFTIGSINTQYYGAHIFVLCTMPKQEAICEHFTLSNFVLLSILLSQALIM